MYLFVCLLFFCIIITFLSVYSFNKLHIKLISIRSLQSCIYKGFLIFVSGQGRKCNEKNWRLSYFDFGIYSEYISFSCKVKSFSLFLWINKNKTFILFWFFKMLTEKLLLIDGCAPLFTVTALLYFRIERMASFCC